MFERIEEGLVLLAEHIPVSLFAFLGSFIEEVVAPVPSPLVMLVAGSIAKIQMFTIGDLAIIVLIATCGKTLGALTVYGIAYAAEDVFLKRVYRFLGIAPKAVEALGQKLTGTTRDYLVLTALRALPIVPSVMLSAGAGILKLPLRLFLCTTFLGTIVRDAIYLYAGYVSTDALRRFVDISAAVEEYILVGTCLVLLIWLALYLRRRRRASDV